MIMQLYVGCSLFLQSLIKARWHDKVLYVCVRARDRFKEYDKSGLSLMATRQLAGERKFFETALWPVNAAAPLYPYGRRGRRLNS